MKISEKIYDYLKYKKLQVKDFADLLEINKVTLSAMLNERNRFSQDFFEALSLKCPDIDLNMLINPNHESFVKVNADTPHDKRVEELENSLKEIKKIVLKMKV